MDLISFRASEEVRKLQNMERLVRNVIFMPHASANSANKLQPNDNVTVTMAMEFLTLDTSLMRVEKPAQKIM